MLGQEVSELVGAHGVGVDREPLLVGALEREHAEAEHRVEVAVAVEVDDVIGRRSVLGVREP